MLNFFKNLFKKNYESLSAADFKAGLAKDPKAVLLDVRSPGEFAGDKIKGAKNINVSSADFGKKVAALDKSKTYYVYCRSGARSGMACNHMAAQGFQVYNLSGGIMSWPY
ncbi:MAG: rhodanese-like domain-containing protein [Sphingobacteriaceae bacterium]|nr:rhodanese-like domain-containing protein [Sphingobacteriaceae bacterium]